MTSLVCPKDTLENLRFRIDMFAQAREDESFRKGLEDACRADIKFFFNLCCWGFDSRLMELGFKGDQPFVTYPFQDEAIDELDASLGKYDLVWEKSRGQGATYIALFVLMHRFLFSHEKQDYILVSFKEQEVDDPGNSGCLFWKMDYLLKRLPSWMRPKVDRARMRLLNRENGVRIIGTSTVGDIGVGQRPAAIMFDEFAVHDYGDAMVRASRDSTNCRWFISTHRGMGKAFYKLTRDRHIAKLRSHWSQHPVFASGMYRIEADGTHTIIDPNIDPIVKTLLAREKGFDWHSESKFPDEYDFTNTKFQDDYKLRSPWFDMQCRRAASRQEIAQELEIDPAGSGSPFFDGRMMEDVMKRECREPDAVGDFHFDPYEFTPQEKPFRRAINGHVSLWCDIDPQGDPQRKRYVIGADIATGSGASNSVASVVERDTGIKVAEFVTKKHPPEDFACVVVALCRWFCDHDESPAHLAWEKNGGPGYGFGRKVKEIGFRNIYYRRMKNRLHDKKTKEPGFHSDAQTKYDLLKSLREALGTGRFTNPSRPAMTEALEYQEGGPGKGPTHPGSTSSDNPADQGENHGDRVIADGLANMLCTVVTESPDELRQRSEAPPDMSKAPPRSIAYLMNREKTKSREWSSSRW